jgi:cytochrome c
MKPLMPLAMLAALTIATACSTSGSPEQRAGSERSAPNLMIQYGCPTCHVVPNVPGAVGKVGPSLASLSQRSYLAG